MYNYINITDFFTKLTYYYINTLHHKFIVKSKIT